MIHLAVSKNSNRTVCGKNLIVWMQDIVGKVLTNNPDEVTCEVCIEEIHKLVREDRGV